MARLCTSLGLVLLTCTAAVLSATDLSTPAISKGIVNFRRHLAVDPGAVAGAVTDNALINDANREKANKVAVEVRKIIKDLRGGDRKFYEDLMDALLIIFCDQKVEESSTAAAANGAAHPPNVRFVPENDAFAYKDENGDCIRLVNPEAEVVYEYSVGNCEVKPNCYWSKITPGDTQRIPKYSITEAQLPPEGALLLQDAKDFLIEWGKGLAMFIAPGIVLGVLSLLSMILFLFCRCCCNSCGGRSPKPEGYSCSKKLVTIFVFIFFAAGIAATAGIALLYNQQVTNAVSDVFSVSIETLDDSKSWITNASNPLKNIVVVVDDSVENVSEKLQNTDFIDGGIDQLTSRLDDFGRHTANVKLPRGCRSSDAFCYACDVCTSISDEIIAANNQMRSAAESGLEDFKDVKKVLNEDLVGISDTIKTTVDETVSLTDDLQVTITDAKQNVVDIQVEWDAQDQYRDVGVLAMFALALVVVVLGVVGVIFGLTPLKFLVNLLHIAYIIGFVALIIGFIVASVLIALSVVMSDVCELTSIMREDWEPVLGADAAKGMNTCFSNDSTLLEAFNLTETLKFADELNFPDMDISSMIDFSEFDRFADTIDDTDESTFSLSTADIDRAVEALNDATEINSNPCTPNAGRPFTSANVRTPWTAVAASSTSDAGQFMKDRYDLAGCNALPIVQCSMDQNPCTYAEFVHEIWYNITTMMQISDDMSSFVADMKTNMTGVSNYISDFKLNISNFEANIDVIKTDLDAGILKNIDDFKAAMTCRFIEVQFDEFYGIMCDDLMPALTMISLCVFLMGIFLIPVNITLIILCKRLKAKGNGGVIPGGTEFK